MNGAIYLSTTDDPYWNLAFEESLCRTCKEEILLFLWQNHNTVVIGKSQNVWSECSLSAMQEDCVKLARRTTGGGAVFHDRGNLNFSFIFPSAKIDKEKGYAVIQKALKTVKIHAVLSGRNDLTTVDGKKFSGNAFRLKNGIFLHHGTLLISSETGRMGRYLSPSFDKLKSKGVASVPSRVINLSELNPSLTVDQLKEALIRTFKENYSVQETKEAKHTEDLLKIRDEMADPLWLYGKSSKADVTLSHRFSWGSIELQLIILNAAVSEAIVYTDALETELAEALQEELCGCAFLPEVLSKKISQSGIVHGKDLSEWLKHLSL